VRRFLEAAAQELLAPKFVLNQDLRRLLLGASGLDHLPNKCLSQGSLCEASNKLIVAINQPTTIAAGNCVSRVGVRQRRPQDLGERQAENYLACIILDLYGIVPWILTSGYEYMFEVLGSAHHFAAGRLHIGEVEAKFVVAPTLAVATNVKKKARHAVSKG
jgi:hypothetical protein